MIRDETSGAERNTAGLAVLLIAHGSRRPEANADLEYVAAALRERGYQHVQCSYLELVSPDVAAGGRLCVEEGARRVILMPYFLSAGVHATADVEGLRQSLAQEHPGVLFTLAQPLGRHGLLVDLVEIRLREAR